MPPAKRIALVTCGSNFERHGNIIRAMKQKLAEMGQYALYVITNYGVYQDGMDFKHGEPAIYSLLENMELDGCILEANLGSDELTQKIVAMMKPRNIPMLTINLEVEGIPYLHLETKKAGAELLNHLILDHGCSRINLVLNQQNSVVSESTLEIYQKVLREHHLPYDEKRIITIPVSTKNGRALFDLFDERGVMRDAQAILCLHDVYAIGLILELESRGYRVPEDFKICSMNCSGNSIAFRPDITGIDRRDQQAAEMALELMDRLIKGQPVPMENVYSNTVRYLSSCGCSGRDEGGRDDSSVFQRIIVNKIEAGNQIGRMMQFTDTLEKVNSLTQLADNIHKMMDGLDCHFFFCCLNESDSDYIESNREDTRSAEDPPYDQNMRLLIGCSERTGVLRDITFPTSQAAPIEPCPGDLFVLLPIHHISRDYGYLVIMNNLLPADTYNYRICQESIGINIDNLHRQMIMRFSIEELNLLHMQDQMTGLHNRFAIKRYADDYVLSPGGYSVAMLDMDGLKNINDTYGHLAGNNAISIVANVIREFEEEQDLSVRYGGDEFLVLSHSTDGAMWEKRKEIIRAKLSEMVRQQQLPYQLGVSMGYAVSPADCMQPLNRSIEIADGHMYEEKKQHKGWR